MRDFGRVRRTPAERLELSSKIHLVQAAIIMTSISVPLLLIARSYLRR